MVAPAPGRSRRWAVSLGVALAVVAVDAITKWCIRGWLGDEGNDSWQPAGGFLKLEYVENRGAAFGMLSGHGAAVTVVGILVVAAAVVIYARVPLPSLALTVCLGLVVGGATGNIIERVSQGYVVDFIAVGRWPRFNVADSAVTVGVIALAWIGGASRPEGPLASDMPGPEPSSDLDRQAPRPLTEQHDD